MFTTYQKTALKQEMKYNLRGVYWHFKFLCTLAGRYLKKSVRRNTQAVYKEYDAVWQKFWDDRLFFSNDRYPFLENGKRMDPMISPYQYQMQVTDKMLADYIKKYNFKRVLEVGSGTGLHLLNLAALFPDVEFFAVELTQSGVELTKKLLVSPPPEFPLAYQQAPLKNVQVIQGSILSDETTKELAKQPYDFVFTTLVLEQLHNYLDVVFSNIFKLDFSHFLFHEQWFEFNTYFNKYRLLIDYDYFRAPMQLLNQFPAKVIEAIHPAIQPMGMNVVGVFGEKT